MMIIDHKAISVSKIQDIIHNEDLTSTSKVIVPELFLVQDEYLPIVELGGNCFNFIPCQAIQIPKTVKNIKWSFYSCKNLIDIYVDNDNLFYKDIDGVLFTKNGENLLAFPNARKDEYYIPEGTKRISNFAFKTSHLRTLHIPASVSEIGTNAFYDCHLKDIYFEGRENRDDILLGGFSTNDKNKHTNPNCHFGDKSIPFNDLLQVKLKS